MTPGCRNLWAREVSELYPHHIRGFCRIPCWAWPLPRPHVLPPSKLLMPGAASSDFWLQPSWITKHRAAAFSQISIFFFSPTLQFRPHSPFHFLSPSCVPPQRSGLQLKLIQAWGGSDDFSWKTASFLHFGFNPCRYPVAAFYSYNTEGQGHRAVFSNPCFSFSERSKVLSSAFPLTQCAFLSITWT